MKAIISILFLFLSSFSFSQTLPGIDSLINQEMKEKNVAALVVAVIDSGRVIHLSANGYRDIANKLEATVHTPFHIASISKTVTNMAVFKLVEAGKLDLNADINRYLSFIVKNPHYPDDIITTKDLLNHRSGIRDDYDLYGPYWNDPQGDPTIELDDFMKSYLDYSGDQYKREHYESESTYKEYSYSNTGVALLGVIVESVSGMSYEEYCKEQIFDPIGMKNTSWFLRNLDSTLVAKTYAYSDSLGLVFHGHNGYPDYPGGQLRTSITDYSNLLASYMNAENGKFILKKETTLKITPIPRYAHDGFFTWFLAPFNNNIYYNHGGGDVGVRTFAIMDVDKKRALIVFSNSSYSPVNLVRRIETKVWSK